MINEFITCIAMIISFINKYVNAIIIECNLTYMLLNNI